MGCTASKLENEDTVRRCKERRRLIKEAVHSRHQLASAHSDYLRALRLAASALTRFAKGEPLAVSDRTPLVLLHRSAAASVASSLPAPLPLPQTPPAAAPRPPPRRDHFFPSPSPTIASSRLPHIISAPNSFRKTPPAGVGDARDGDSRRFRASNATYAATPSQSSSAWDWENFYPPSPPDSEFFERRKIELEEKSRLQQQQQQWQDGHHLPPEDEEDHYDKEAVGDQEEAQCPEWGSHYSGTTSSDSEEDGERESRSGGAYADSRSEYGRGFQASSRPPPSEIGSTAASETMTLGTPRSATGWQLGRLDETGSSPSSSSSTGALAPHEMGLVVRHQDLAEILSAIEEYFMKVAASGDGVSDLFEIGRAQLDQSYRQIKKTVYHSNSVLSALSSTWSSKPPLAVKYRLDTEALEQSGGRKSHSSTLERLLAWEKKLYEEVKAREGVKLEHEKKLSTLQSQESRGRDDVKLDKTKASIKKLQSLILVTSEAVTATSTAITKVRDSELAPQLVELCFGLLSMWRQMYKFHEVQNFIVQQVRGLVNRVSAGESTSDLHRLATRDLEVAISSWHSSFNRLIKYQREYIRTLYGWLKLTLFQVSSDNPMKDHASRVAVELVAFCDEWKQALDRLPDTVASEAIKSFMNVIHVIYTKQAEELKVKKRAEVYSKELEKKSTALRNIEKKYYQSYSMVGIGLPGSGREHDTQVFDARDPLSEKKLEIAACRRKVEDEMSRHAKAVEVTRSLTLNNIQTGLPGVFQAMTGFSGMFVEALEGVCRRAGSV